MLDMKLEGLCVQGEPARLIPTLSDSNKERRALSVFLASLLAVDPFRKLLLSSIDRPFGVRSKIECYTEVVFKDHNEANDRNDGLIVITSGGSTWRALVEAKIGSAELKKEQLERYIKLAKANKIDALITISNEFATLPTHHPIPLTKNQLKGLDVYHWSWMYILTQAILLLRVEQTIDPDQRYLLDEVARFLEHDKASVRRFDTMSRGWRESVLAVKTGERLEKGSTAVQQVVGNWHQLQRDISLLLTRRLARPVATVLSRKHAQNQELRFRDGCENLAVTNQLSCAFHIPDAASSLGVSADLMRRTITCVLSISAPGDRKSAKARTNWLLRQLSDVESEDVFIRARWPGRSPDTQESLIKLREDPELLSHPNKKIAPNWFDVLLVADLAGKFSGAKTFIERLERIVPAFYEDVAQNLRNWNPPPPKMRPPEIQQDQEIELVGE